MTDTGASTEFSIIFSSPDHWRHLFDHLEPGPASQRPELTPAKRLACSPKQTCLVPLTS